MFKKKIADYVENIKQLNGDPHYIALGMAIGVFAAITPTIPFHTVLALVLAILFKASKPAAILGVWVSNPLTVFFLYFACYKIGHLFFDGSAQAVESIQQLFMQLASNIEFFQKINFLARFVQNKLDTFLIMIFGGIVLGLPSGLAAYIITKRFFIRLREYKT
ncbi:MAG: DUF2062 domain-containing protein [Pseudomonadota bacterium]